MSFLKVELDELAERAANEILRTRDVGERVAITVIA
jgi:hypothetical protein